MIIFGLGNPDSKYKETRHNIGFMVLDKLAKRLVVRFRRKSDYHIAYAKVHDTRLKLVKPMLYMNNSGLVVSDYVQTHGKNEDFIVVYDDMALPLGKIRIREKGSDAGHQGMASIIYCLSSTDFPRLRIGIGSPNPGVTATDYVLEEFTEPEKPILEKVIETSCIALLEILESDLKTAMNKYNPVDYLTEPEIKE